MTEEALYPLQREALSEDSIFLLAGTRRLKDRGIQKKRKIRNGSFFSFFTNFLIERNFLSSLLLYRMYGKEVHLTRVNSPG